MRYVLLTPLLARFGEARWITIHTDGVPGTTDASSTLGRPRRAQPRANLPMTYLAFWRCRRSAE